ncbi:putative PI3/PI4-kinase family protein C1F5.11c [Dissostichus eleginoides]|uniref:PI3/PI4-kinase family protein C1F5.11c n=1 Tax=Dissostichus eleginoides TaxID=100907 RepID=A0AAD9C2E3_DISEL|nr:putative PI3/PI4-kinase family protein C1F5.11c [Dissostichus eleginoides]
MDRQCCCFYFLSITLSTPATSSLVSGTFTCTESPEHEPNSRLTLPLVSSRDSDHSMVEQSSGSQPTKRRRALSPEDHKRIAAEELIRKA